MAQQTVLTRTTQQTNEKQGSLGYFLEIASFFLDPQNQNKTFDNFWTFEKIDVLLKSWAVPFNSEIKNAPFEDVVDFLESLGQEETIKTVAPDPEKLKELIVKAEEATRQAEEIRQTAQKLVEKLTKSPIPQNLKTKLAADLSANLQEAIEDPNLLILAGKAKNLPQESEERRALEQQIEKETKEIWEKAVEKTVVADQLSPEQKTYLDSLSSVVPLVLNSAQTWAEINDAKDKILSVVEKNVPLEISQEVTNLLFWNQIFASEKTIIIINPEKERQDAQEEYKKALNLVLKTRGLSLDEVDKIKSELSKDQSAEIAVLLDKARGISGEQTEKISRLLEPSLSPQKAEEFVAELLKSFPDNLNELGSPEEATLVSLWQMAGGRISLKPEEAAGTVNTVTSLSDQELAAFRRFSPTPKLAPPKSDILQIADEKEATIIENLKRIIYSQGINNQPEADSKLSSLKTQVQTLKAIRDGVTQQDFEKTIQGLIQKGLPEDSPQIKEIRIVQKLHKGFLEKARRLGLEKKFQTWIKQGPSSVRLLLSNFNTLIEKTGFKKTLLSQARQWFLNTALGKPVRFALEKSAQKSLQFLWTGGKEGIKKFAIPVMQKILVALGIGAKTALVAATNVVGLALIIVPKLIGKVKDSLKKIISSTVGIFGSILSGITGASEVPESQDFKWLKWIFILLLPILFLLGLVKDTTNKSALLGEGGELGTPKTPSSDAFAQCESSRHFSEQVYCVLKECGQTFVTRTTISKVATCLSASNLRNKELISSIFYMKSPLSCIVFVYTIEKAIGHDLERDSSYVRNACNYFTNPPSNYELIPGNEKPQPGDIAIWNATSCGGQAKDSRIADRKYGHSAFVLEIDGNVTLFAAEANGHTGEIRIMSYIFGDPTDSVSPNGFLRYKGR